MNIWRGRLDFPALVRKALELQEFYRPDFVLVEDAGSGTSLIQTLKEQGCSVSAMKPTGDKVTRMHTGSVFIEAGKILLPEKRTPALDEYFAELLAFPNGEHDDQVDSTSQFLGWLDERRRYCPPRILKLRMY